MIRVWYLIFVSLFTPWCYGTDHVISKRALLFPRTGVLQFTYGLTVPLVLPRRSINLSLCVQTNYNLPNDTTLLQPMTIPARQYNGFFSLSRTKFYHYVVEYLDSFGLEGEACLLRSICEISESPMYMKDDNTLLEKIVHFVFTPSLEMYTESQNLTKEENLLFEDKLLLAEQIGKEQGTCEDLYSDCLISVVDLFSSKYIL